MSQQTKFGLLLVVVLTSVFGVLVYKRMHKPADLVAGDTDPAAVAAADGLPDEQPANPQAAADNADVEMSPLASAPLRPQPSASRTAPTTEPADPFKATPIVANVVSAASSPTTNKRPADLDDDFFAPPVTAKPAATEAVIPPAVASQPVEADPFANEPIRAQPVTTQAAEPFDPFASEPQPPQPVATTPPSTSPAATDPDPFADEPALGDPVSVSSSSSSSTPEAAPVAKPLPTFAAEPADSLADPFAVPATEAAAPTGAPTLPLPAGDVRGAPALDVVEPPPQLMIAPAQPSPPAATEQAAELEPFDPLPAVSNAAPQPKRVPVAPPQSLPLDLEEPPVATSSARSAPLNPAGATYVVEPNDNFWTISKKLYGAGRYFQALADHNAATVPDPSKLRPGTTIATPTAAELEARYPAAISAVPATSGVQPVGGTAADRHRPDQTPGFFVGSDGQPMYRVGAEDTLSGIAYAHLGRASRWVQILEMNRGTLKDGNTLKIGVELRLPADASQVQVMGGPALRR